MIMEHTGQCNREKSLDSMPFGIKRKKGEILYFNKKLFNSFAHLEIELSFFVVNQIRSDQISHSLSRVRLFATP